MHENSSSDLIIEVTIHINIHIFKAIANLSANHALAGKTKSMTLSW